MRIQRVSDIPHGGIAVVYRKAGHPPVVQVDASLVTEDQAHQLAQRLDADPDLLKMFGAASV